MARYNKIRQGPAQKNCPQVQEAIIVGATAPGTLVELNASNQFVSGIAEGGDPLKKYYVLNHDFVGGGQIDDNVTAGVTAIGEPLFEETELAVLLLTGNNITKKDTPLTISATAGVLKIATGTDEVLFWSKEVYNNNTGSSQLLLCRPAK